MFAPSSAPVTEPYLNEMEFEKLRLSQKGKEKLLGLRMAVLNVLHFSLKPFLGEHVQISCLCCTTLTLRQLTNYRPEKRLFW